MKTMDFKIFLLLLLVLSTIDDINARRSGGGSRSGSRSGSRGGGSRHGGSSGSHGSTSGTHGTSPGTHGTSPGTHGTSSGSHGTSSGGGWSTNTHGTSYGQQSPVGHGSSSTGHGTPAGSHIGQTGSQNKDVNSIFLHGEGGGATRPAQPKPAESPSGSLYPSAPPLSSFPSAGSHFPTTGGKPNIATESKQTSPYNPSAPYPNQAPNSFGQPSAPPYGLSGAPYGRVHGTTTGHQSTAYHPHGSNHSSTSFQQPTIGFKDHISTQQSPAFNPHYPATPGNPPYPTHGNPPYPTHGNPSYPSTHGNPSYPQYGGHPSYPYGSYNPPPIGSQGFGQANYPHPSYTGSAYHPSQVPMGNPYSMHPTGSAYNGGQVHYPQQPQVLAQPASQPFVPGQTIIMVPGQQQQSSGRGLGQMFTEALVFSTVNAGVNRLINPHHSYSESRPVSTPSNTETHITYNNQYFNGVPGSNETWNANAPQGGSFPPGGNYPTGSSYPNGVFNPSSGVAGNPVPGSMNSGNVPINTIGNSNSGGTTFIPGSNTGVTGTSNPAGAPTTSGSTNGTNVSNNQNNVNSTANINMPQYRISDDDLMKISEELFAKNTFNVSKYIKLNLQNRSTSPNVTDLAKEPLIYVEPELLDYPSIYVTRALYDNYEHDSRKKENRTLEKRQEENLLLDTFLNTNIMSTAMQWLADRGFIDPDDFERKDVLRHIWFNVFDGTTSGFERVFTSENYSGTSILGVQDWNYFEYQETLKRIDYMGYVEKVNLGNTASLLKLNFQMDGVARPNATIFVGTLPELQMSLYTICFYARPNNLCPVSLGGTKFNIFTHSFRYFGNDLIDLGLPMI